MHTTAAKFRRRVEQTISSAPEAIKFIQRQHSVNYASQSRKVDSGDEDAPDRVMPTFFLDFLAILGKPGEAVSKATDSHPLSSISISFKDWAAPYSSKHLNAALSFSLTGRTFKIGADGLRMTWFIVVAPDPKGATFGDGRREGEGGDTSSEPDRSNGRPEPRNARGALGPGGRAKPKGTALKSWRAKRFIEYFHKCVSSTILGRGIEESWRLWSQETAQISLTDWAALQRALVSGWDELVVEMSVQDRFWAGTQLAFHAYGYGGTSRLRLAAAPRSRSWRRLGGMTMTTATMIIIIITVTITIMTMEIMKVIIAMLWGYKMTLQLPTAVVPLDLNKGMRTRKTGMREGLVGVPVPDLQLTCTRG